MSANGRRPSEAATGWARCDVCNSELDRKFDQLDCLHRFCSNCTGITREGRTCPLCVTASLSTQMVRLNCSHPTLSPDFHPDPLTVETSFRLWDPLQEPPFHLNDSKLLEWTATSPGYNSTLETNKISPFATFNVLNHRPPWSRPPPTSTFCSNCTESRPVSAHCEDCREFLCFGCVDAHYRVRVTRDHRVFILNQKERQQQQQQQQQQTATNQQQTTSSSSSGYSPLIPGGPFQMCAVHDSTPLLQCKTCADSPICSKCLPDHKDHNLVRHLDGRTFVSVLLSESKHYQRGLEEAVEAVQRMAERVEASVQAAVGEARSVLHMHIGALEERKRDMLQRIDVIRQSKMCVLNAQSEQLHSRLAALTNALVQVELATSDGNNDSLEVHCNQELLLNQLQDPRCVLAPFETDQLRFVGPEKALLARLRTLGSIQSGACARTSHVLGDGHKKAIRNRPVYLTVQARDAFGEICTRGGDPVTVQVTSPDGGRQVVHVIDSQNGTYLISHQPVVDGVHELNVFIRGCPVVNSPVCLHVRQGRNYNDVGPNPSFSFGGEGGNDGQLCRPWGICCDRTGRIIVADRSNNRVQIFDRNGAFLLKFGTSGSQPGQFNRPAGVTVDQQNQIIVADKDNHRVQLFNSNGTFVLDFGKRGNSVGLFNYPWDVSCNSLDEIAVSDTRNHRVQVFTGSGQFVRKLGFDDSLQFKHLDSPRGLCFLPDGQLLITDFNNHRLAVASANSSNINRFYGREGEADGMFKRPQGIDVDLEGYVLMVDSRNNRIQVLSPDDLRPLCNFGGLNPVDRKPILDRPTDVCLSPDGRIYVVDFGKNCVHVY